MAISDAEFNQWLIRENVQRCVLLEVQAYSGGSTVTRYMSTHGFVSYPTDTPANTAYDEILLSVPRYNSVMSEQLRGYSKPAEGTVNIDNSSGIRDSWLLDAWDGRPFSLYLGDPSWPKADFRLMVAGAIADIVAQDSRTLTLRTRDRQHLLEKPINTALIGGTDATKDAKLPVCYGECYNVEPVLTDSATRTYAVHDGQIEAITAVYENGAAKAFTANLANGTFTLTAAAAGRITADVKGSKTGGTYVNKTADIIQRILTERTTLTGSDIDAAAITALNTDVAGAVGIYVTDGDVLNALDQLALGCGAFYTFDRSGKFYVAQLKAPAAPAAFTILQDDVAQQAISVAARWLPSKSVRVGYKRMWAKQADGLAAGVADARRAELDQGYSIAKATNTIPQHLLADDPEVELSLFVASSDASAEATRRAALYSTIRLLLRVTCFLGPARAKLGDVVQADLGGRFGMNGTAYARIVGIDESPTSSRVELTLFV